MQELMAHPAADAFPMMEKKRFDELVEDIRNHGQRELITLFDGLVLDGRNRYKACLELGIDPETREWDGDPWAFVWSLNGTRRDLVQDQRYLIWKFCNEQSESFQSEKKRIADEANRKRSDAAKGNDNAAKEKERKTVGGQSVPALNSPRPGKQAKATAAQVNTGAVARGDKLANDRPDLAEKVRMGEMKPTIAYREMKRDEVSQKVQELPKDKYSVIYADPPWDYNDKQGGSISDSYGAAEKHYPSMPMSDLKAMSIPDMCNDDAVLFLWATCPLLENALELCRAWGFKYKAQFVWDKVSHNMGHYNSVRHELLLICTKGSATPEKVKLFDSVQSIQKTKKHSEKPQEFRDIIETLYPSWKKIELFARQEVDGWDVWGNEC